MNQRDGTTDLFPGAQAVHGDGGPAAAAAPEIRLESPVAEDGSIGARLRAAREQQGLTLAACGARLHLPVKVLERLEGGDLGTPEHFVFLRGALTGYARLLELPADVCAQALLATAPSAPPPLTAVARTSHARWLLQRYGTAATYIVLTAMIAVPLVVLGLRGGLQRPTARIVSLDHAPSVAPSDAAGTSAPRQARSQAADDPDASPYRASMTPFAAIGLAGIDPIPAAAPLVPAPLPAAAPGQHTLAVTASADCWFQVTGTDGKVIDSGMLHAGDSRTWDSATALHVTLGNASAVTVLADGKPFGLGAFENGSVARFSLFGAAAAGGEND